MLGIVDLPAFVIGTILVILLPGPNSLYVLQAAARFGWRCGVYGILGILLGDSILMLLTVSGAVAILRANPMLFFGLQIAGALYLAWIGLQMLRAGLQPKLANSPDTTTPQAPKTPSHLFRKALLISLLNPKAILFFVSFFVQFVDPAYSKPAQSFLILGLIVQLCSLLYLSVLITTGSGLAQYFRAHPRLQKMALLLTGTVFIGFGFNLAYSGI